MANANLDKLSFWEAGGNVGEFKLYINDLPLELNEDGIRQIFDAYGEIKGLFTRLNAGWCYISYGTFQEAEHAIRSLHDQPPLRLKVQFARERKPKQKTEPLDSNVKVEPFGDFRYRDGNFVTTMGRGTPLQSLRDPRNQDLYSKPGYSYTPGDDLLYPCPSDSITYNPYENAEPYRGTNGLWARHALTVTRDGKRHVSMGRGYTMCNLPDPHPDIEAMIHREYEKRHMHMYEYGPKSLNKGTGKCQCCSKITKTMCQRCCTFYCGKECQTYDWPRHIAICQTMPSLVDAENPGISRSNGENKNTPVSVSENEKVLRRPRVSLGVSTSMSSLSSSKGVNENQSNNSPNRSSEQIASPKRPEVSQNIVPPPLTDVKPLNDSDSNLTKTTIPMNTVDSSTFQNVSTIPNQSSLENDNGKPLEVAFVANFPKTTDKYDDMPKRRDSGGFLNNIFPRKTSLGSENGKPLEVSVPNLPKTMDKHDDVAKRQDSEGFQNNANTFPRKTYSENQNGKPLGDSAPNYPTRDPRNTNYSKYDDMPKRSDSGRFQNNANTFQNEYVKPLESSASNVSRTRDSRNIVDYNYDKTSRKYDSQRVQNNGQTFQSKNSGGNENINPYPQSRNNQEKYQQQTSNLPRKAYIGSNESTKSDRSRDENHNKENTRPVISNDCKEAIQKEQDISFQKDSFLSRKTFVDIEIVVPANDGCYFVRKVNDKEVFINLMRNLQDVANSGTTVDPVVGHNFAVKYDDIWHRAKVLSLNPLKVHYIDFGNVDIVTDNDLRLLKNLDVDNIPQLIRKIRISGNDEKYQQLEPDTVLPVKMVFIDNSKIIHVEVPDTVEKSIQPISNNENPNETKSTSIISTLNSETTGILEIHATLAHNTYGVTLLPENSKIQFVKLLYDLPEKCTNPTKVKLNIGDLICGQREGNDWVRGHVLDLGPPIKMSVIDEARVATVLNAIPCPKEFTEILEFGVSCEVMDAKIQLANKTHWTFTAIKNLDSDKFEINMTKTKDDVTMKAIVKPWIPLPEQKGISFAQLESGCDVIVSSFLTPCVLYVRSLERTEVERFQRVIQQTAKCAQLAPLLTKPPVVGSIVIARYESDGNYYRAIVTKISDEPTVGIAYIDYGNTEKVSWKTLRDSPDDLKQMSSCAAKVRLRDVPKEIPMTSEVHDYLVELVGKEIASNCTFTDVPSQDGVVLTLATGETINEKMKLLLTPTYERDAKVDDKTCYTSEHLPVISLGEVNHTVDAFVLVAIQESRSYVMCPYDMELMEHVFSVMPALTKKYAEGTEFYIPRALELCIAYYEDAWYRGLCLCPSTTPTSAAIFFVDYGNIETVNHENIRLMTKDFITPNALGTICSIVNLAPVGEDDKFSPDIEKRVSELVSCNICVKIKIVAYTDAGSCQVELPEVHAKLIKEGLIKS